MPFTLVVVGVAIAVGYARGGRLHRLAKADIAWTWLLFAGLALQVGLDVMAVRGVLPGTSGYPLLLASQVLVLLWVWFNRYRPGMILIAIGLFLNAAVIAANGAMPVEPDAIEAIGLSGAEVPPGKHVRMTDDTAIAFLGDVYPLPPLRTIISIGDVVLAAGLIPLVVHLMRYRTPAERRGGRRTSDRGADVR